MSNIFGIMFSRVTEFIKNTYNNAEFIALHEPRFLGNEKKYINDCLNSTFVSSVGKYVTQFEDSIVNFTGAKRAIACVNGTEALHLALRLAGVRPGDEVITQPLTFVATANAISYTGGTPVFIDVDKLTLGLSPQSLEAFLLEFADLRNDGRCYNKMTGKIISACVPMHTYGHPARIDEIVAICNRYLIPVVEDSAESLGSRYKSSHTGTFGLLGIISFNGNKIVTTGGGGMIITNNEKLADLAKHLSTQAKVPHPWEFYHDHIGYNYRLPNLNSALGVAQMEQLDTFILKKRKLAEEYRSFFAQVEIGFIKEPVDCFSNYWLNTLIMNDKYERDLILKFTNQMGVMTRPAWNLMNRLPMFQSCFKTELSNAEWLSDRIVNIPSSVPV